MIIIFIIITNIITKILINTNIVIIILIITGIQADGCSMMVRE